MHGEVLESTPLLPVPAAALHAIRCNFVRLGAAIGVTHATVATALTLGTVVLGRRLGAVAAGTDRAAHAVGAMFLAPAGLLLLSAKRTMRLGRVLNCVVISCHMVGWEVLQHGTQLPGDGGSTSSAAWPIVITSAVLEGCAAAWLWTATASVAEE